MDENEVRSLLGQLADSGGPPSSVDVAKARRAGLRRLLRRVGAPAASFGAIVTIAGLVATGAVPLGAGSARVSAPAQATVRLKAAEIAVLTNSGDQPRDTAETSNAFEVLVQRCMQSKGFKYYPSFKTAADERGFPGLAGVPQAPIGLAAREANGYGFHPGGAGQGLSREEKYADSAGRKYVLALDGSGKDREPFTLFGERGSISTGGCRGHSERRLYRSAINYLLATTGSSLLTDALLNAVTADPAFTAVVGRWSSCMAGRGFAYSSPENLWNSLAGRLDRKHTPALRNLEIKVSLADYKCAKTVALLVTVRALQARHARYFSKALSGSLTRLTRIDARALRIAQALHLNLPGNR